eukprot:2947239-Pyramimonas_sp.AAC.1
MPGSVSARSPRLLVHERPHLHASQRELTAHTCAHVAGLRIDLLRCSASDEANRKLVPQASSPLRALTPGNYP